MYKYIISISMAEKGYLISDEFIASFIKACEESNQTLNSIRNGRKFTFLSRIGSDNLSIKVSLESQTAVIPTRAISSITRALLRSDMASTLKQHIYKGSVITATIIEETELSFQNMTDAEIVQSVIDVFFGQLTSNKDKDYAKDTANKIREVIRDYRAKIKP